MINLHFFCLESGVEQSSSVGYNIYTDKQEVITQRFGNRTVRKERSVSYSKMQHQSTVIALNARISLYQDTHTQTLEKVLWPSEELAPMQINFLQGFSSLLRTKRNTLIPNMMKVDA